MEETKPRGRVLRLKTGYNPNSSSVGSNLPQFFAFAVASGALLMAAMQIASYFRGRKQEPGPAGADKQ